jgi:leader peptidase (prepilin peptidase) / N-methyltransferase
MNAPSILRSSSFTIPVVIVAVAMATLIGVRAEFPTPVLGHAVMVAGLVPLVVIDLETLRLPRELSYPVAALSTALLVLVEPDLGTIVRVGGGAMLFVLLLLVVALAAKGGLGGGDVRLAPLLGANLGYHGVLNVPVALVLSSLLAVVVAAPGLISGNLSLKSSLPFGPFLAVGTVTTLILVS